MRSVVARNSGGTILFAAIRCVQAYWALEIAECETVAMTVKLARKKNLKQIFIESDSNVIISGLVNGLTYYSDLDSVFEDVICESKNFNFVKFSHVRTEGNMVDHHLAKLIPFGTQ